MDDLIERRDALNMHFSHGINNDGVLYVPFREVMDNLKALPSEQTTQNNRVNSDIALDLIERQAAIDYVNDVPYVKEHPNIGLLWKAWIEQLPSAQQNLQHTCNKQVMSLQSKHGTGEKKMADAMAFQKTAEQFMELYKIVDTEHVYTNGAALVPIFRMKQWFDHMKTAKAEPTYEQVMEYCRRRCLALVDDMLLFRQGVILEHRPKCKVCDYARCNKFDGKYCSNRESNGGEEDGISR